MAAVPLPPGDAGQTIGVALDVAPQGVKVGHHCDAGAEVTLARTAAQSTLLGCLQGRTPNMAL